MRTNKCKPCGESSPYWNWVDDNATGDPDYVGVEDSKGADPLLQSVLDTLDEGGEQVLTKKQRIAFQLVVREGMTYRAAARTMRIPVSYAHDLVKAGAKKLRILSLTKLTTEQTDSLNLDFKG